MEIPVYYQSIFTKLNETLYNYLQNNYSNLIQTDEEWIKWIEHPLIKKFNDKFNNKWLILLIGIQFNADRLENILDHMEVKEFNAMKEITNAKLIELFQAIGLMNRTDYGIWYELSEYLITLVECVKIKSYCKKYSVSFSEKFIHNFLLYKYCEYIYQEEKQLNGNRLLIIPYFKILITYCEPYIDILFQKLSQHLATKQCTIQSCILYTILVSLNKDFDMKIMNKILKFLTKHLTNKYMLNLCVAKLAPAYKSFSLPQQKLFNQCKDAINANDLLTKLK